MRHNEHRSRTSLPRIRIFTAAVIVIGAMLLSADVSFPQSKNPSHKSVKKSTESKKKETRQAKEKVKESEDAATMTEKEADAGQGDKTADTDKKEEKQEAKGDLNMRDYGDDDFRPQVEEESTVWLVFKTIFVLGSIIGGFYFFFKFVTKKTGIQLLGQDVIKVLAVVPLGQNKYLQVVDMAGKVLVLGITENSINVLSEILEKDEIDRIRLLSSKTVARRVGGFQEYLTAQIGKMIEKVSGFRQRSAPTVIEEEHVAGDLDYLRAHRQRLRDLNGNNGENT